MTEYRSGPAVDPDAAPRSTPSAADADELLGTVADLPLDRHPDVYEQVHTGLQSALADINDA